MSEEKRERIDYRALLCEVWGHDLELKYDDNMNLVQQCRRCAEAREDGIELELAKMAREDEVKKVRGIGFEIWDRDARQLIADFDTLDEALGLLRDSRSLDHLQLVQVTSEGKTVEILAEGSAIADFIAERERRDRLMQKMVRDAEESDLAEKLGNVTPDDVVKLQDEENQRTWADDIARGLEDLTARNVTVWDTKLMARLRRMLPLKRRKK